MSFCCIISTQICNRINPPVPNLDMEKLGKLPRVLHTMKKISDRHSKVRCVGLHSLLALWAGSVRSLQIFYSTPIHYNRNIETSYILTGWWWCLKMCVFSQILHSLCERSAWWIKIMSSLPCYLFGDVGLPLSPTGHGTTQSECGPAHVHSTFAHPGIHRIGSARASFSSCRYIVWARSGTGRQGGRLRSRATDAITDSDSDGSSSLAARAIWPSRPTRDRNRHISRRGLWRIRVQTSRGEAHPSAVPAGNYVVAAGRTRLTEWNVTAHRINSQSSLPRQSFALYWRRRRTSLPMISEAEAIGAN